MLLNTIIAFTLVMLTATPSYTATKQKLEACKTVEATALYVMGMRQKDYKMSDVFAECKGHPLCERMVISAFSQKSYLTDDERFRATNTFAAKEFKMCLSIADYNVKGLGKIQD